jgi:hypothetical protein
MGRTIPTYRLQLDKERHRWNQFRTALRVEDQPVFDTLFHFARTYADAGSAAARPCTSEAIFMSMLLGLYKEVQQLRHALAIAVSKKVGMRNTGFHEYVRRVQTEL